MVPLIRDNMERIADLCRTHRVHRLFLIGSALGSGFDAGEEQSDVDFLVEFKPQERKGFDDAYFLLLEDLEKLLGRQVDLIERHTLRNPVVKASIEQTKVPLYAAA